jgi:hypothetical protein
VIAGKGCFESLDEAKNHDSWNELTSFKKESELLKKIRQLNIQVPTAATRGKPASGIDLGTEWNAAHKDRTFVDVEELLHVRSVSDKDLTLLLGDEAVDILTLAYKTRGKLAEYRSFLLNQKVDQLTLQLEDFYGAASIIAELGKEGLSDEKKNYLQLLLQEAHNLNRDTYCGLMCSKAYDEIKNRNRLIDRVSQPYSANGNSKFIM